MSALSQPRILVIDDEEYFRLFLVGLFEQEQIYVISCTRGKEALERLEQETFDLIIIDYQLPDMLGMEILDYLQDRNLPTPRVMVTAYGSIDIAVQALKKGASDFFTKPLADPHAFVRFLNRTLTQKTHAIPEAQTPKQASPSNLHSSSSPTVREGASAITTSRLGSGPTVKDGTPAISASHLGSSPAVREGFSPIGGPSPQSGQNTNAVSRPGDKSASGLPAPDSNLITPARVRELCAQQNPPIHLSRREYEVIAALLRGLANKEIASGLYISERTVKNHLTSIYRKFDVDGRSQLFNRLLVSVSSHQ